MFNKVGKDAATMHFDWAIAQNVITPLSNHRGIWGRKGRNRSQMPCYKGSPGSGILSKIEFLPQIFEL